MFYEALDLEFRREFEIVRDGQKEATNYLFGPPGQVERLELTLNHDDRNVRAPTAYPRSEARRCGTPTAPGVPPPGAGLEVDHRASHRLAVATDGDLVATA